MVYLMVEGSQSEDTVVTEAVKVASLDDVSAVYTCIGSSVWALEAMIISVVKETVAKSSSEKNITNYWPDAFLVLPPF